MPERVTITQRADGRYVSTIQLHGKRRFVYGKSEREVRRKIAALQQQTHDAGVLPTPGGRTVNDLLDAWIAAARPVLKPRTVANYVDTATRYIRPELVARQS